MSNRVYIQFTKFTDLKDDTFEDPNSSPMYGLIIWDDYDSIDFAFDSRKYFLEELAEHTGTFPVQTIKLIRSRSLEKADDMLDFVRTGESGIYINSVWRIWDEIKEAFETKGNDHAESDDG